MLSAQLETLEKNASRVNSKLKAMSGLQFGDKWNTTSQSPQKNTVITALLRTLWYWGESWKMSIADFNSTLEEAFTLIYECVDKHPHFSADEQDVVTRLIVQLTDNVSNVKMALIRQKAGYTDSPNKDAVRTSLDEVITYVENTLADVSLAVTEKGIHQKIDKDYRSRKHKSRNPVIIPGTDSVEKPADASVAAVVASVAAAIEKPVVIPATAPVVIPAGFDISKPSNSTNNSNNDSTSEELEF